MGHKPKATIRPNVPPSAPWPFDEVIFAEVLEHLATGGTLRALCADKRAAGHIWPTDAHIRQWVTKDANGCHSRYARARQAQAEAWSDYILEASDDGSADTITTPDGREACNHEWIARSRLKVDTRKWLMSKLHPGQYGDKIEQNIKGDLTHRADGSVVAMLKELRDVRGPTA